MDTKRLILVAGLIGAAGLIFLQVRKMGTPSPQAPVATVAPVVEAVEYVDILVSAGEITSGTRLSPTNFKWRKWPKDAVSSEFISREDRGQAMDELTDGIARTVIYEGEPISDRKIVMAGEKGLMSALVNPGMRAVTTRISADTAVGGFIQPGDNVDIILTVATQQSAAQQQLQGRQQLFAATTIFENVRVLAIDQTFSTSSESGATVIGSTATFELTQQDAEILQASAAQGDITLTLRPLGSGSGWQAKSRARIQQESTDVSSLTVYRNGQAQQVAVTGQ